MDLFLVQADLNALSVIFLPLGLFNPSGRSSHRISGFKLEHCQPSTAAMGCLDLFEQTTG